MMNYLIWNIRGVANNSSVRRLKQLIKKHSISLVAIIEPKCSSIPIVELQTKLKFCGSLANEPDTIWLFWNNTV